MSTAKRIAKNTTVLLIATIISYILGLFTTLYTARYLGAEGFGVLTLAISLTAIFGILTDLGLSTLTVREVARDKDLTNKYVVNVTLIKIILSFLMFGLIIVTAKILNYSQMVSNVVFIMAFSTIFGSFIAIFNAIFQSYEKMEYQSVGSILNAALMFAGVLIAWYYNLDILAFAFIYFISNLVVLIYSFIISAWKISLPKIDIDWSFMKRVSINALPFAVTGIFTTIYYWIDSVLLSQMAGNEVVGWYGAAYRLILLFSILISVYMVSIFPVMSRLHTTSQESLKIAYKRSFRYLLIISLPVAVATTLLADKIILLIYGTAYIPTIIALQILIWTIIFMFMNNLSLNLLGAVNRQNAVAKIVAVGAVSNIILNLLLIHEFSYVGSSVATVLTELLMLPVFFHVLLKTGYIEIVPLIKDLPKIIIANVVLMITIVYLNQLNLFLILLTGTVVYLITIYITKTLDTEDITLIKGLIDRKK